MIGDRGKGEVLRTAAEHAFREHCAAFVLPADDGKVVAYGTRDEVAKLLGMGQTQAEPSGLLEALRIAEAALADIGDADREPGDDLAWCERRAAQDLPTVRLAIIRAINPTAEKADVLRLAHEGGISADGYEAIAALMKRPLQQPASIEAEEHHRALREAVKAAQFALDSRCDYMAPKGSLCKKCGRIHDDATSTTGESDAG